MHLATVCFLLREGDRGAEVLLGRRKSSFMDGIWNGPGGKREPPETLRQCAARETLEEIGVRLDPEELVYLGVLNSYHPNGDGWAKEYRVHYYVACQWDGKLKIRRAFSAIEWYPIDAFPLDEMPPDTELWLLNALMGCGRCTVEAEVFYADPGLTKVARFTARQRAIPHRQRRTLLV